MKKVTVSSYKKDVYFPKVVAAMQQILSKADVVSPIQVFLQLQYIDQAQVEDWRKGRIPFLERVIRCNMEKASRMLRLMAFHANDLKLKPSFTAYKNKATKTDLRFSKFGDPNLEKAYATSFVRQAPYRLDGKGGGVGAESAGSAGVAAAAGDDTKTAAVTAVAAPIRTPPASTAAAVPSPSKPPPTASPNPTTASG